MTRRAFKIPPLLLCVAGLVLAVGELATGTNAYFVIMMLVAILSIGVTYNLLGGVSTFSGLLFAGFAARSIVISQIGKVLLWEAADKNLEAPHLTITVYAVFYFALMLGASTFCKLKIPVPQPISPATPYQKRMAYRISLVLGTLGTILFQMYTDTYGGLTQFNRMRSIGLALSPFLVLSLILATERRIQDSNGKHSLAIGAILPSVLLFLTGFTQTVRTAMLMPVIIYLATCLLRGYRLKLRHVAAVVVAIITFSNFLSPAALYTRAVIGNKSLSEKTYTAFNTVASVPRSEMQAETANEVAEGDPREEYFSRPGGYILSRLSLIRVDSTLISACSHGFHYGFTQIKEMITEYIPSYFYKNKSQAHENNYISAVAGLGDYPTDQPVLTMVADSYGAFGWLGVVIVPLFFVPAVFVLYDNMFDLSTVWGTVALGIAAPSFWEMPMTRFVPLLIQGPIDILLMSYVLHLMVGSIPRLAGTKPVGLFTGSALPQPVGAGDSPAFMAEE